MAGRQHLLDRALMKEGVHIASLVGTRNKKEGRLETASYVWFQGSVAEGRGREEHGGVTIAVNKEWMSKEKVEAREYCVMEGRIGAVRLVGRNLDLTVTAAYAPTEGSLRSTKAEFWDGLKEWLRGTPRRTTPMVLLDANTEMEGRAMNGAKFRDLVGGEWHVMNTRMRKGDEGWTWRQGQRRSKIDFGLVPRWMEGQVREVWTDPGSGLMEKETGAEDHIPAFFLVEITRLFRKYQAKQ